MSLYSIFDLAKKIFKDEGLRTFSKVWSWFDLVYCIVLPWITISNLDKAHHINLGPKDETSIKNYLEALLSITIWGKMMYYL